MFKRFPLKNILFLAFAYPLAFQVQAGSDTFIDFEATIGADDNVTRADDNVDIENDAFFTVAGTVGKVLLVNRSGILKGKILLEANKFARFDGLSNVIAAGKLNYTFGFGSGFGVPWFSLEADYGVAEFDGAEAIIQTIGQVALLFEVMKHFQGIPGHRHIVVVDHMSFRHTP